MPITALQLQARVHDGAAVVDRLAATWGTAQFGSSGRAPLGVLGDLPVALPSSGGIALDAWLTGLNRVAVLARQKASADASVLTVSASTSGSDIAGLEGRATFDELELSYRDCTLAQQQPAAIAAEAGRATIETLALAGSVGNVTAEGTLGLSGERTLDVATEGTLDIAAASAFTDRFRAGVGAIPDSRRRHRRQATGERLPRGR